MRKPVSRASNQVELSLELNFWIWYNTDLFTVVEIKFSNNIPTKAQSGWVGLWAPAHWGPGEIDGLLVPPGKASNLLTDHI